MTSQFNVADIPAGRLDDNRQHIQYHHVHTHAHMGEHWYVFTENDWCASVITG